MPGLVWQRAQNLSQLTKILSLFYSTDPWLSTNIFVVLLIPAKRGSSTLSTFSSFLL